MFCTNGSHLSGNFFLTALRHCLLQKGSNSIRAFWESLRDDLSSENFELCCYSEFSCERGCAKFDFLITSYLWKPNLIFVYGIDRPCFLAIKNKDIENIYFT